METGKCLQVTNGTQPPETFPAGCYDRSFLVSYYRLPWLEIPMNAVLAAVLKKQDTSLVGP